MWGRCRGGARLLGAVARYRGGPDIGTVTGAFVDASSGRPEWVVVRTERLLPVRRAHVAPDGRLVVALPDLAVELSPPLRSGTAALHLRDEDRLHGHYAAVLGRARDGAPGGVLSVVSDDPGSVGTPRATRAALRPDPLRRVPATADPAELSLAAVRRHAPDRWFPPRRPATYAGATDVVISLRIRNRCGVGIR